GFGDRGVEGKIAAAGYARTHGIPYLGICLGMQVACIEFARTVGGLKNAHSTEFEPKTAEPVIALVTEWHNPDGAVEHRDEQSGKGGTMRLGEQGAGLMADTLIQSIYGAATMSERHRHRYEFNDNYRERLAKKGLIFSAESD